MRIGAGHREPSRNNGERVLSPGHVCVPRADGLGPHDDTVLPKGAHVWHKGDDGLSTLEKSARALPRQG